MRHSRSSLGRTCPHTNSRGWCILSHTGRTRPRWERTRSWEHTARCCRGGGPRAQSTNTRPCWHSSCRVGSRRSPPAPSVPGHSRKHSQQGPRRGPRGTATGQGRRYSRSGFHPHSARSTPDPAGTTRCCTMARRKCRSCRRTAAGWCTRRSRGHLCTTRWQQWPCTCGSTDSSRRLHSSSTFLPAGTTRIHMRGPRWRRKHKSGS